MSELSERAKAVMSEMRKIIVPIHDGETIDEASAQYTAAYTQLIEQALLGERRLAMELAEKVIEDKINDSAMAQWSLTNSGHHEFAAEWDTPITMLRNLRRDLRSAARTSANQTPVATPRGGE